MQANELLSLAYKHSRLTPKQEWIMGLYMAGYRQREIAAEVGCSQPVVSRTIKICIVKLRKTREIINGYDIFNIASGQHVNIAGN